MKSYWRKAMYAGLTLSMARGMLALLMLTRGSAFAVPASQVTSSLLILAEYQTWYGSPSHQNPPFSTSVYSTRFNTTTVLHGIYLPIVLR